MLGTHGTGAGWMQGVPNSPFGLLGCLFIAAVLTASLTCSNANDVDDERTLLCMENIRASDLSTPDCRSRATEICLALSRKPSFVTRAIVALVKVKGIACENKRWVGFGWGFCNWSYNDCVVVTEEICRDWGQYAPCMYEACLADIPQDCA